VATHPLGEHSAAALDEGPAGNGVRHGLPVTGHTQRPAAEITSVSKKAIGKAAVVLKHLPDLANEVLVGATTLDVAYEDAESFNRSSTVSGILF
jgi:hypothetical protein